MPEDLIERKSNFDLTSRSAFSNSEEVFTSRSYAALLAKNEMIRMIANRSKESDPLILGAAKEVAKLFLDMSESLHGKGVSQILEVQSEEDLEKLSTDELKAFIAQNS